MYLNNVTKKWMKQFFGSKCYNINMSRMEGETCSGKGSGFHVKVNMNGFRVSYKQP